MDRDVTGGECCAAHQLALPQHTSRQLRVRVYSKNDVQGVIDTVFSINESVSRMLSHLSSKHGSRSRLYAEVRDTDAPCGLLCWFVLV